MKLQPGRGDRTHLPVPVPAHARCTSCARLVLNSPGFAMPLIPVTTHAHNVSDSRTPARRSASLPIKRARLLPCSPLASDLCTALVDQMLTDRSATAAGTQASSALARARAQRGAHAQTAEHERACTLQRAFERACGCQQMPACSAAAGSPTQLLHAMYGQGACMVLSMTCGVCLYLHVCISVSVCI
jgi:hypothetical protein